MPHKHLHEWVECMPLRDGEPFDLKTFRERKRESQETFWARFGISQSNGSRYETGLSIPAPVTLLVRLYAAGKLNDGDLL